MSMNDGRKWILLQIVVWILAMLVGLVDSLLVGYTVMNTYGAWVFALSLLCFGVLTTYFMQRSLVDALNSFVSVSRSWIVFHWKTAVRWLLGLSALVGCYIFAFYLYHSFVVQAFNLLTVKFGIAWHTALILTNAIVIPAMFTIAAMMIYDFIKLINVGVDNGFMWRWFVSQSKQVKKAWFKRFSRFVISAVGGLLAFLVAAITTSVFINGYLRYQSMFKFAALPHSGPQTLLFIILFILSARLLIGAGKRMVWGMDYVIDNGVEASLVSLKAYAKTLTWKQCLEIGFMVIALPFRAFLTGKFFSTQAGSPLNTNPHLVSGVHLLATDLNDVPVPVEVKIKEQSPRKSPRQSAGEPTGPQ